jgi:hypothetical protein
MTGRRAKSGPLLPLLSALAGDDIISRLRLVMICPIFFGSNIPERLPEIGVYWCGERVGFCQYHPGKPDRTVFLLPFGRGVVSAQRNKDFLAESKEQALYQDFPKSGTRHARGLNITLLG